MDTKNRLGTHFQLVFRGSTITGLHKFTDSRLVDSIARRLSNHVGYAVEVGYGPRTGYSETYSARWFDGDVFHEEQVELKL